MEKFEPDQFLFMGGIHVAWEMSAGTGNSSLSQEQKQDWLYYTENAETLCRKLGLPSSEMATKRMKDLLSQNAEISSSEILKLADELEHRLIDEMKSRMFFCVEPDKQRFITDINLFGEDVATNFPSATFDIEEVGKCIAFEHWTASVFHSMRVLEIGLSALANELKVADDRKNWENVINGIEVEIKKVNNATHGDDWLAKQQFYSEAALQFRYFKNAWRNHVMHVRDSYDEQRAEAIFDHVKQFMQHLATKLTEATS